MTFLLFAKVTLVFAAALAVVIGMRSAAADTRHKILAGAQLTALALPVLTIVIAPLPVTWITAPQLPRVPAVHAAAPNIEEGGPALTSAPQPRLRFEVLALVWLAGCVAVATTKLVALGGALAIVRRARPFAGVLLSGEVDQPSTLGRWILLPRGAESWNADRLGAVLLHEEAHVARHDTLLGLLGEAACAVYWFHPLAWLVARRARLERERACDDRVLARGVAPDDYAAAMIHVARSISRRNAAVTAMADRSQLEARICAVLDPSVRRRAPGAAGLAVIIAIIAAAPILAALTPASVVPRPRSMEPDLLGDDVASPFSERVRPAAPLRAVDARGRDAALIAFLAEAASRPPRGSIDFVPERARWALTRVRDGELVEPLIESLQGGDWRVRAYAAWALGHSQDLRATAQLVRLLDEPVWRVRAMAAYALAGLADPAAEAAMLAVLDDPAWQVRSQVVKYLAAFGTKHEKTLEAMREDRHVAVRSKAEEALDGR